MRIGFFLMLLFITTLGCAQEKDRKTPMDAAPVQTAETDKGYKRAYFASGCFWCSESIYESVIGVQQVVSGYSGGTGENPIYQNYERKGHSESIEVIYDPKVVDYLTLLTVYFGSQNVTQQNGQGPDRGSGYRSIIFYQNEQEKQQIEEKIAEVQKSYGKPVAAEVRPFQKFWRAEEYHQNYEEKHPANPYIRNVSLPRLYQFQRKYPELVKKNMH